MEYRPLGRTGVQVSKLCLGTMMFGAWRYADHDDSIRIIHAGITFVGAAGVYSAGESEESVTINPEDNSYGTAELEPTARRR
jgi:aryl-alcohol dehydrogenase-like predicted oxidoreductase